MQHQETATIENHTIEPGATGFAPAGRHPKLPLGVGSIISESFSILSRHIIAVFLIGFIPVLFGQVGPAVLVEFWFNVYQSEVQDIRVGLVLIAALLAILQLGAYSLTTALVVQLAYDARLRRRMGVGRYLRRALAAVPPIMVLSIAVGAILGGILLLVAPFASASRILALLAMPVQIALNLWILAVFSVMAPAIVIERVGLRGLGRSAELTKGYRWPILGTLFLMAVIAIILTVVAGFLIFLVDALGGTWVAGLIVAALSSFAVSMLGISVSLIYARLREIKEGVSVDQIATVFD